MEGRRPALGFGDPGPVLVAQGRLLEAVLLAEAVLLKADVGLPDAVAGAVERIAQGDDGAGAGDQFLDQRVGLLGPGHGAVAQHFKTLGQLAHGDFRRCKRQPGLARPGPPHDATQAALDQAAQSLLLADLIVQAVGFLLGDDLRRCSLLHRLRRWWRRRMAVDLHLHASTRVWACAAR